MTQTHTTLLDRLHQEMTAKITGGIYHKIQIELTYNSNHIEGSRLTQEQTRYIYETNTIGVADQALNVDDIIETSNHFRCVDIIIHQAKAPLTPALIKQLHHTLKSATADARKDWFALGDYKRLPNEVGGIQTTPPQDVPQAIDQLLSQYNQTTQKTLHEIIAFHVALERIHPFQDGNGRVGRLILFKECLRNGIVPFIITDANKFYYYRGLQYWDREQEYLIDTCLASQDHFKTYLDYFQIAY